VERLVALELVTAAGEAVMPRPPLARYAADEPSVPEESLDLFDGSGT
jgi:hypothetical protein